MSHAPLVATMTGSTTTLRAPCLSSALATASMMAADDTMPTFTAAGRMSSNTASICAVTNAGSTSSTPNTPVVFCAVRAVTAVSANRRCAAMVLMSA